MKKQKQFPYRVMINFLIASLLFISIGSCTPATPDMSNLDYKPFVAPSLSPTQVPTKVKPTEKVKPTTVNGLEVASTLGCTDNLVYISDITIPDGTVVVAGSTVDKQWEVRNSGTCTWNEEYYFQLEEGNSLDSDSQLQLPAAESGSIVTVRMLLTAPSVAGSYLSAWQAYNPDGTAFGDLIYIEITAQ